MPTRSGRQYQERYDYGFCHECEEAEANSNMPQGSMYKQHDRCKRHRLEDNKTKTVRVPAHYRRVQLR